MTMLNDKMYMHHYSIKRVTVMMKFIVLHLKQKVQTLTMQMNSKNYIILVYCKVEMNLNLDNNKTYKKTLFHNNVIYALVENGNAIELYTLTTTGTTQLKLQILSGITSLNTISMTGLGDYIYIVINNVIVRYDIVNNSKKHLALK